MEYRVFGIPRISSGMSFLRVTYMINASQCKRVSEDHVTLRLKLYGPNMSCLRPLQLITKRT